MSNLKRVLVNGTFKQTWINSGAVPSSIIASVLDGSGTIVSSGAGVSSGNGHYYFDVSGGVSSQGYYVSQWDATLNSLPYKNRQRFKAVLNEVD